MARDPDRGKVLRLFNRMVALVESEQEVPFPESGYGWESAHTSSRSGASDRSPADCTNRVRLEINSARLQDHEAGDAAVMASGRVSEAEDPEREWFVTAYHKFCKDECVSWWEGAGGRRSSNTSTQRK